jgi:hypothetical protein
VHVHGNVPENPPCQRGLHAIVALRADVSGIGY